MGKRKLTPKSHRQLNASVMKVLGSAFLDGNTVSCFDCKTPHCCKGRKSIDITPFDKKIIATMIKDSHGKKAVQAMLQKEQGLFYTCPFLDDSGRCGIYDNRPIACSSYAVVSSPADCEDPNGSSLVVDPFDILGRLPRDLLVTHFSECEPIELLELFL